MSAPDLLIRVHQKPEGGHTNLYYQLHSKELNWVKFGPQKLRLDHRSWFERFHKDMDTTISGVILLGGSDNERRALMDKGLRLFEDLFPQELQETLWNLRDKVNTIRVETEEEYIPWELCCLQGAKEDRIEEGLFMCEAFQLTRWLPEKPIFTKLTTRHAAVLKQSAEGLDSVLDEILALKSQVGNVTQINSNMTALREEMSVGDYDLWHIVGHGQLEEKQDEEMVIILDDGRLVTSENITGIARNIGHSRPLVFMNCCFSAHATQGLTGIGSWAESFIRAGAGAFIGAMWSVTDQSASLFARTFYQHFLAGETLGVATNKAREAVRQTGDVSWLAYTVYGDPDASIPLKNSEESKPEPSSIHPWLERFEQFDRGLTLALLSVAAVVREPLSVRALALLAKINPLQAEQIIKVWPDVFSKNDANKLTVDQDKLAPFLQSQNVDLRAAHQRILTTLETV